MRAVISEEKLNIVPRSVRTNINFLDRAIFLPCRNQRKEEAEDFLKYDDLNGYILYYPQSLGHPTLFDQKVLYTLLYLSQKNSNQEKISIKCPSKFLQEMNYSKVTSVMSSHIKKLEESIKRWSKTSCDFSNYRYKDGTKGRVRVVSILNHFHFDDKPKKFKLEGVELDPFFVEQCSNSKGYTVLMNLDRLLAINSGIAFRCYEVLYKNKYQFETRGVWEIGYKNFVNKLGLAELLESVGFKNNGRQRIKKAVEQCLRELEYEGFPKLEWSFRESVELGTVLKFKNINYVQDPQTLEKLPDSTLTSQILFDEFEKIEHEIKQQVPDSCLSMQLGSNTVEVFPGKLNLRAATSDDYPSLAKSFRKMINTTIRDIYEIKGYRLDATFKRALKVELKVASAEF